MSDGLLLYGIALLDGSEQGPLASETSLIQVRDLGAVTTTVPYQRITPSDRDLERHAAVLEGVASSHAIAPAPVGTVFHDRVALTRWLELHYHALHESLSYLDGRAVARVHVVKRTSDPAKAEGTLAAPAAEIMKSLRPQAAAMVPLRTEQLTGTVLSAAFLVERDKWGSFSGAVGTSARAHEDLDVRMTGPWPPYDFVKLDLGG